MRRRALGIALNAIVFCVSHEQRNRFAAFLADAIAQQILSPHGPWR